MTLTCKIQTVICALVVVLSIIMCSADCENKNGKIKECALMPGECTVRFDEN